MLQACFKVDRQHACMRSVRGNTRNGDKNYRTLLRPPGQMDARVLFAIAGRAFGINRQLEAPGTFINAISHDN